jgi:hypothetical protein
MKSGAFHGPLFRQFTAPMAQTGRLVTWSIGAPRGTHPLSRCARTGLSQFEPNTRARQMSVSGSTYHR